MNTNTILRRVTDRDRLLRQGLTKDEIDELYGMQQEQEAEDIEFQNKLKSELELGDLLQK